MEKQLNIEKMQKRMREMEAMRFVQMQDLFPLEAMPCGETADTVHVMPPASFKGERVEQGARFTGRDDYLWLKKQVQVPQAAPGLRPAGRFDFGKTGEGHNSGFEALLYLNGQPFQGVDSNHMEVMLEPVAGQEAELCFLLWSGLEGGGPQQPQELLLRSARLGLLHEDTDALYYLCKAAVKTLQLLPREDPAFEDIYAAMEAALQLLDWDEDCFHATAAPALACLRARLAATKAGSAVTIHCVGHTHIDLAWLWRLKHTREKAVRSFSTVLRLMDEFEEYRFFQSQPQLYQYVKEDAPALYARIKDAVKSGRWEPDGGMWVEADCNISSGEALTRQFLYGCRFFMEEFGKRSTCLWLPDVFGYSWALPQIMQQCGITTFATTKISWNQFNTMPDDLFCWRGMDGSEVMTYFINTPEVGHAPDARFATYNGQLSPRSVLGSWKKFKNKELGRDVLIAYGYGDGGGGPTRNMLQMRRAMAEVPGLPAVECGSAGGFFAKLHERADAPDAPVHTWDGELYLEYHRGTYTSQAKNKWWNRLLEHGLVEAEMLEVLAGTGAAGTLREAWEIVLRNQFHDIIPGSSIREVYQDSDIEYARAAEVMEDVRGRALAALTREEAGSYTLFSPSSFGGRRLAFIEGARGGFSLDGETLPCQQAADGVWVEVPAVALKPLTLHSAEAAKTANPFTCDVAAGWAESPLYRVEWNTDGVLTRLYDKENRREALRPGGLGGRLEVYEDKPLNYENWDVDLFHTQKCDAPVFEGASLREDGPLRQVVRFSYRYRHSAITVDMVLCAGSRRIDFDTTADWHESHRLLKAAFDTGLRATRASYDIQYGHVERPTHRNTSWDMARFEVVGHKWADISEDNYGVSLLNNCKYGYSAQGSVLRLSLLKSGKFPDTEADMGQHQFTYALLPHAGGVTRGDTIEQASWLNLPLRAAPGAANAEALLTVDSSDLLVDTIKVAEDGAGIIVRLHECRGGSCAARLTTSLPVKQIQPCNLLEEPAGSPCEPQSWEAVWRPFEIKSFRLLF